MKELICIVCPKGCRLHVGEDGNVTGNSCPRGAQYGYDEATHPKRILTTTVAVYGGRYRRCPVRTADAIPKEFLPDAMNILKRIVLDAPVTSGQIVFQGICGTNIDVIATRDMKKI